MFDTTTDDNSNVASVVEESDLNVSAVVAKKQRPSTLKRNRRKTFKSGEMPAGAIRKLMIRKQMKAMDRDKIAAYLTYSGNKANIDYSRCDSLVPSGEPFKEAHYKVSLLHTREIAILSN